MEYPITATRLAWDDRKEPPEVETVQSEMVLLTEVEDDWQPFELHDGDYGMVSFSLSELEGFLAVAIRALAAHHGSTYRTVLDRALDTLVREDSGK